MEEVSFVIIGTAKSEKKTVYTTMTISFETKKGIEGAADFKRKCRETFEPAFKPMLDALSNYMIAFIAISGSGRKKLAAETARTIYRKIREASQEILHKIRT